MSKIDTQIETLQRRKAKIAHIKKALSAVKKIKGPAKYPELNEEIYELLDVRLKQDLADLEAGIDIANEPRGNFSKQETKILKELAARATKKKEAPAKSKPAAKTATKPSPTNIDPIKFALAYKGLDGARVKIPSGESGTVRGLLAPYALVVLEGTGREIHVEPQKLTMESK